MKHLLHAAISKRLYEVVNNSITNIDGRFPLYTVIKSGDERIVKLLIEQGAKVNDSSSSQNSYLPLAII